MKYSLLPLVFSISVALPSLADTTHIKVKSDKQTHTVATKHVAAKKSAKNKNKHGHRYHVNNIIHSKRKMRRHEKSALKPRKPSFKVVDAIMDPQSLLVGTASYYGSAFQGKKTASGERFNQRVLTAAHRTIPLNSLVEVTNLKNNKKVIVRINDRGPWIKSRIIDLSKASADRLGIGGIAQVSLRVIQ